MRGLLVFGRSGQVATELARLAPEARFIGREEADLSDASCLADLISAAQPAAIINAAAHTAVDRAESEPELAHAINAEAPFVMARAAAKLGVPFLHISTDYVFDGSGEGPWSESDATGPLGAYGASKLAGERGVSGAGGQWAVMRTSWVFSAHSANFVKTMLRLGAERKELRVVADQYGGPTPAADIAAACLSMTRAMLADPTKGGIYHFSGAPDTTWSGFAREIMDRAGLSCRISDIETNDYLTPARRPGNSRLDCSKITINFDIARPDWRAGLDKVLTELRA